MSDRAKSNRRRGWTAAGTLALVALAASLAACRSLAKPALEGRLAALGKNAAMPAPQRMPFRADLGDGERDFELVYAHVPALEPVDAVPVVLVHGTPSTLYSWTELVFGGESEGALFEGLRRTRDVYAIEVIGHGFAPGDASPYTFERCAQFVVAAIRALGLERVHLVGSSYGGEFAWRAALNAADSIESLALLDTSGFRRADGDWLPEEVVMRDNSLAKIGWVINSRERIETALAPHFRTIPPDRVEEFFLVCENAHNWKAMIDLVRDEEGSRQDELGNIAAPTLVLWGELDVAYTLEDYGRRFVASIPSAELAVVPGTGHYPHEERPAEVVRVLTSFFDRVGGTR